MKRVAAIVAGLGLLAIAAFYAGRPWQSMSDTTLASAESLWYHASDVEQLARTGRPQLVEFFHPG
jgi:hypothetical protein